MIYAVYKSGSCAGNDTELLGYLDCELYTARRFGQQLVVAGDFNVHNVLWLGSTKITPAGELAEKMCYIHGLEQHITTPTRGSNILRLIMSDFPSNIPIKGLAPMGASHHSVSIADFPVCTYKEPKPSRTVWRYNQADWGRINHFFRNHDWDSTITGCPEWSCSNFTNVLLDGMQRFIPSRQLSSRQSDPGWRSTECTDAVRPKQHAWKAAAKDHSHSKKHTARLAAQHCIPTIDQAKHVHFTTQRNKLSAGNLSDRGWWSTIKQAGGSCRNTAIPTLVDQSGHESVSNTEKAECFGQLFASKCSLGGNDFPATHHFADFPRVRQRTAQTLSSVHFRQATVRRELRRLNPEKATGPDAVPARVLKLCADVLYKPLAKLFSLCFHSQVQPASWKTSRVVPIHKKKSKNLPPELRPCVLAARYVEGNGGYCQPAHHQLS